MYQIHNFTLRQCCEKKKKLYWNPQGSRARGIPKHIGRVIKEIAKEGKHRAKLTRNRV